MYVHSHDRAAGYLELENAVVRWFLTIDYNIIPKEVRENGQRTFRSIKINGEEIEFSGGFTELHTMSYKDILNRNGFRLLDAKQSIEIVHDIRNGNLSPLKGDYQPFVKLPITMYPFHKNV